MQPLASRLHCSGFAVRAGAGVRGRDAGPADGGRTLAAIDADTRTRTSRRRGIASRAVESAPVTRGRISARRGLPIPRGSVRRRLANFPLGLAARLPPRERLRRKGPGRLDRSGSGRIRRRTACRKRWPPGPLLAPPRSREDRLAGPRLPEPGRTAPQGGTESLGPDLRSHRSELRTPWRLDRGRSTASAPARGRRPSPDR